mgnify:CR=1 FL=1
MAEQLWKGRFSKAVDSRVNDFNSSIRFDQRMIAQDMRGSGVHATMLAMQRAVAGLHIAPEYVLIDGNRCPALPVPSMAVVKGDSRVAEISAASILAKVTRDAEMAALDTVFPQYGFAQHKGYPTVFHLEKLALHGATEHHRRSFGPVKRALGLSS